MTDKNFLSLCKILSQIIFELGLKFFTQKSVFKFLFDVKFCFLFLPT
jgi:hypothetical protein